MAPAAPVLREVALDDKYTLESGRVYLTGAQALVRLLMLQRQRDQRGRASTPPASSPATAARRWAASTRRCGRRAKFLDARHIAFQPGLNEDLAATAVWGTQQVNLFPGAKYDGVFACGTARARASTAAATCSSTRTPPARRSTAACWCWPATTTRRKSSTLPHQSEHAFAAAMMPVLYPARCRRSSTSACTAGRCRATRAAGSASSASPTRSRARRRSTSIRRARASSCPTTSRCRRAACRIRWPDASLDQEARLQDYKVYAALPYCRVNRLNRDRHRLARTPRLGIVTTGKSYLDVRQALDDLGIDERDARRASGSASTRSA